MKFEYFYKMEAERFSYIMLPKALVKADEFKSLSSDAKILYACLLERTSLSIKNKWIDSEDRVYIIFTIQEIMETLNISNKTAVKILCELDSETNGIGLIERKRQGLGKPNIIYVKDFMKIKERSDDNSDKLQENNYQKDDKKEENDIENEDLEMNEYSV